MRIMKVKYKFLLICVVLLIIQEIFILKSHASDIQNAIWFMDDMCITQVPGGNYSHAGTQNFDVKGVSNNNIFAPFDCKVVAMYTEPLNGNTVIIESLNRVKYADGTVDYMSMAFGHDNDISNLYIGKEIKQKEVFYQTGNKDAEKIHSHVTCIRGKYQYDFWTKTNFETWSSPNGINPTTALHITERTNVIQTLGLNFIKTSELNSDINSAFIDPASMTETSYKVKIKMSDNNGVDKVQVAVYTLDSNNVQSETVWRNASYNSSTGYYEYTVKKSEHNNVTGMYFTHIHAWDKAGNKKLFVLQAIPIGTTLNNSLGSFYGRITLNRNPDYVIGTTGNNENPNVVLKPKDINDKTQLWRFISNSDGTYKITNIQTGYVIDIAGNENNNGTNVQTYTSNSTDAQRVYIMNYNGGYRIVPKSSGDLKAFDLKNNSMKENTNIQIWEAGSISSSAQTWNFEIIARHLTVLTGLSGKKEVNVGETIKFNANIEPSNASSKEVLWKSDNTNIATIDENGIFTAKNPGEVRITATTTDGSDLTVSFLITVVKNEELIYTTIPTQEKASKVIMKFDPKISFKDILTADKFPILDIKYSVELYDSSDILKENIKNIGSRNIIKIRDINKKVLVEYTVIVPGDVTGNGYVRMYDSFEILKGAVTGNKGLDEIDYLIRDYNEDGNIRMYDAFQYLREAVSGK